MGPWAASRLFSSLRNVICELGHFLLSLEAGAPCSHGWLWVGFESEPGSLAGRGRMVFWGSQSIVPSLASSVQIRIWGQGRQGLRKAYVSLKSWISLFAAMAFGKSGIKLSRPLWSRRAGVGTGSSGGHLKTSRLSRGRHADRSSDGLCFFQPGSGLP